MQLQRARAVLERGIEDGTQIGAQLSVSFDGERFDAAYGESARGTAMTDDSMMIWFSMSKAICAVAVAQVWERGLLRLDEPAATYLPEFAANGKERVTIRHLLTHTAGFPFADGILRAKPWRESVADNLARIYAAPLDDGWVPGEKAGYHAASGMSVLGAIVQRLDGRGYDRYVREAIFEPLGMADCWVGMPPHVFAGYGDRIGMMHNTAMSPPTKVAAIDTAEVAAKPIPGANGRGPMRELRLFYEMLRDEGRTASGAQLLAPQTVAAISARHRVGMFDHTFGVVMDWGLGFVIDSYAMGRHCSARTFGHGGAQSSVAYCDPVHGLCVAVACNGMPGADRHHARMDAISTAIYEDLGLATGSGRDKPYPTAGL